MNIPGGLARAMPITTWLPSYRASWFRGDLLAGLIVAALAVPQALGYAGIAGVPVVVGIYAIPAALIAYALFGSSPHLVVGPVSTVSVLSGSLVAEISRGDPTRAVALTAGLALGAGMGLLLGGLLRLGWAAEFLSRPIVTGFVFGLVLVIIIGEVPKLLGLPATHGDSLEQVAQILRTVTQWDPLTTVIGVVCLVVLFLGTRASPRFPWGLLVLIGAIMFSSAAGLEDRGVTVIGAVPTGLPPIGLPELGPGEFSAVLFGGLGMAMVGLAEGLAAARMLAAREGYAIDSNQELIGAGAANVASGMCGGMGVAGSLSKTAAAHRSGGHTQMTGLLTAAIVLAVLLLFAGALAPLPRTVLSAIVIQAVWGLMDVPALKRYRLIRRNDFVSAIAAMVGVLLFGPLYGLLIAVLLALLGLIYRASRLDVELMGKVPGQKAAWGSTRDHPERRTPPGIVVLRLDAPLFWANAGEACDLILARVEAADPEVRVVLLDLEATTQLDVTSIDALELLLDRLQDRGIDLYLVHVFYKARQTLARSGFTERLGRQHMWHSISAGVRAARKSWAKEDDSGPDADDDAAATSEAIVVDVELLGGYDDPEILPLSAPSTTRPWWRPW